MEGLFSLLLFAAFFYYMMRIGCGAHMVHGHGSHGGQGSTPGSQTDPVCGMEVEPGTGYIKMYERREYSLCSRKCLDAFDANPERYANQQGESQ